MTSRRKVSVAEKLGASAANDLALWAIEQLLYVPERRSRYVGDAKILWSEVDLGRVILEDAGFDWRPDCRIVQARKKARR